MSISLPNYIKRISLIIFFFIGISCDEKVGSKQNKIKIERFEKLFYGSSPNDLGQIKSKYPFFFPDSYPDSVWLDRLNDPIQIEIFNEIMMKYESVTFLEEGLYKFFEKHNFAKDHIY